MYVVNIIIVYAK